MPVTYVSRGCVSVHGCRAIRRLPLRAAHFESVQTESISNRAAQAGDRIMSSRRSGPATYFLVIARYIIGIGDGTQLLVFLTRRRKHVSGSWCVLYLPQKTKKENYGRFF